jgi:hypothetical protein
MAVAASEEPEAQRNLTRPCGGSAYYSSRGSRSCSVARGAHDSGRSPNPVLAFSVLADRFGHYLRQAASLRG